MREYVRTTHLREGDEVSETLYDDNMRVLLRSGNKLTARGIELIRKLGYKGIYIENHEVNRREDIPLSLPLIDNETMLRMVSSSRDLLVSVLKDNRHITSLIHAMEPYIEDLLAIMKERAACNDLLYELQDMRISSNWIFYHSIATCILSAGIAMSFGFPDERVGDIAMGGMLHDLGKALLGGDLYQRTNIEEQERNLLRDHPERMFRILQRDTNLPIDTTYAVWQHHEKCDGSGYPMGIKKEKIHISAQIVALASAFDNLTNITPYDEQPMTGAEAFEYLAGCGLYSVEYIQALRTFACIYSVGSKVQLSDGRRATVMKNVSGMPERPYLLCNGVVLRMAHDKDLMALVIEKEIP